MARTADSARSAQRGKMSTIFTNEWVEELVARYGKPGTVTPALFNFVTGERWQRLRDVVDARLNGLADECREKFLLNFTNPDTFRTAYNELAVAGPFIDRNFRIEYERTTDGLTPDWFVEATDGTTFLLEVFSRATSKELESWEIQTMDLWNRLGQIPVPVGLFIRCSDPLQRPRLDSGVNKQIAAEVADWLTSADRPRASDRFEALGLSFEITYYNSKRSHVAVAGPSSGAYMVGNEPVRRAIETKVKKYEKLCRENDLPLVVGIAPSFGSAIGEEDLEHVLFGDRVMTVLSDGSTSSLVENNGVFARRNVLSAVIGFWSDRPGAPTRTFYNPAANIPLSKDVLESPE
jgi:hypothetical protein